MQQYGIFSYWYRRWGSIIINNQIWHGAHLYGGEFGFMIIDGKQLSELASPVTMAKRYNKKTGKDFDGKTVFELADTDDPVAQEERGKAPPCSCCSNF